MVPVDQLISIQQLTTWTSTVVAYRYARTALRLTPANPGELGQIKRNGQMGIWTPISTTRVYWADPMLLFRSWRLRGSQGRSDRAGRSSDGPPMSNAREALSSHLDDEGASALLP
jgi:hypothetical protein